MARTISSRRNGRRSVTCSVLLLVLAVSINISVSRADSSSSSSDGGSDGPPKVGKSAGSITSVTNNPKPDGHGEVDDGFRADVPKAVLAQDDPGATYVDVKQDSLAIPDVKKAGWNRMKCPPHLPVPGQGACTPANCSKGKIPAKWKTSNLLKHKLGVEIYVKGNPLTVKKASPQTCCNTCAATPRCTYWQFIPDITLDGTKTPGACFLVHDEIDYTCGQIIAQYATDTKPVPLQVRLGGECNSAPEILNDPHLVGAHGTHFDFNGRPDHAFCLLTDRDLHVNMLLRGYYDDRTEGAALVVDGKDVHTWIKELGIVWTAKGNTHKVRLAARSGKQQERGAGFMKTIEIDGYPIKRMAVGDSVSATGGLTIANPKFCTP